MAVETYIATLCSRTYNGTANRYPNSSGTESPAATHGYYSTNGNWIGMVLLPVNLSGRTITGIKLTMTANTAGNTSAKTVYIYSSNHQSTGASGTGSIYPDSQLGSISGIFRNQTTEVTLSGSLLSNVASYFSSGKQMIILYDPTASEANYCRFTDIVIEVTFDDSGGGPDGANTTHTIMYRNKGAWIKCLVYYKINGRWVRCIPTYRLNGRWIQCSG